MLKDSDELRLNLQSTCVKVGDGGTGIAQTSPLTRKVTARESPSGSLGNNFRQTDKVMRIGYENIMPFIRLASMNRLSYSSCRLETQTQSFLIRSPPIKLHFYIPVLLGCGT